MHCAYYKLQELVPPAIYEQYGERAWQFLQPRFLTLIDTFRLEFGPITINNWFWGGELQYCGLRQPDCPVGAFMSIHKFGCAGDLHFKNYTVQEVYAQVLKDKAKWYNYGLRRLEGIEDTPSWLHIDCANTNSGALVIFRG